MMNKKSTVAVIVVICAVVIGGWVLSRSNKSDRPKRGDDANGAMGGDSGKMSQSQGGSSSTASNDKSSVGSVSKEVRVETVYKSPAGDDKIAFTLSLDANGVIVDAKTVVMAESEISKMRQQAFADGLPMVIKGKKLSELSNIDKVGGSSLTTNAFNQSLDQLKEQM